MTKVLNQHEKLSKMESFKGGKCTEYVYSGRKGGVASIMHERSDHSSTDCVNCVRLTHTLGGLVGEETEELESSDLISRPKKSLRFQKTLE